MSLGHLDTLAFSHEMYDQVARAMAFQASTAMEAEGWQRDLRAKLVELLGGFPAEGCELLPRVTETKEFPTYTCETVLFQSRPNMTVFGYMLLPKDFETPRSRHPLSAWTWTRASMTSSGFRKMAQCEPNTANTKTTLPFSVSIGATLLWLSNSSGLDIAEMMQRANGEPVIRRVCLLPEQRSCLEKP